MKRILIVALALASSPGAALAQLEYVPTGSEAAIGLELSSVAGFGR